MSDTAIVDNATDSTGKVTDTPTTSKPRRKPPGNKPNTLTPKMKRFAEAFTDTSNSKTFGNKTQSALLAYNTTKPDIAIQIATETLSKPQVQNYIEELNAKYNNSIEERSAILAKVIRGEHCSYVLTTQRDKDGNVLATTEVKKDVPASQILRAIDLSNKVEGLYNRANVQEHIAKREYDELAKSMREALTKRLKARDVSATSVE